MSLLVENNRCLGYLMFFEGHGIYEPSKGRVNFTKEEADAHNKALSQAEIAGLDDNCEVGMYGVFYLSENPLEVRTWIGEVVSTRVRKSGRVVTFDRKGRTYRGQVRDGGMLRFRRIK